MLHAERPGGPVAAAQSAPPMAPPCLFWHGAGVYGVELYAAVRLAVVDEGLSHPRRAVGSASTAGR